MRNKVPIIPPFQVVKRVHGDQKKPRVKGGSPVVVGKGGINRLGIKFK